MSECCRKSTPSSDELLSVAKDHQPQQIQISGFVDKIVADVKKLCIYNEASQIKWMNEKPRAQKAYEPTEVIIIFYRSPYSYFCYIIFLYSFYIYLMLLRLLV